MSESVFGLIVSLLLPVVLGYSWLHRIWPDANQAAKIGYGYFLGVLITTATLYLYGILGFRLAFVPFAVILTGLSLLPWSLRTSPPNGQNTAAVPFVAPWQRGVWWLFLILLIVRFTGLSLEELWRPLYPWDAWMNWSPKARVWFELKQIVPFVHPDYWPNQSLEVGAYTLSNPSAAVYPPLVPLVQLWTVLGIGEWRDNWVNLPWFLAGMAFASATYGQLRALHIPSVWSLAGVYLLFVTPYANTHLALAGYAELWLSAFYTLGFLALVRWVVSRERNQLVLVLLMMVGCVLTKKPGVLWAFVLALGVAANLVPLRLRRVTVLLVMLLAAAWWFAGGIQLDLPGGRMIALTPDGLKMDGSLKYAFWYHPVGEYFLMNMLARDNWHLLGWLVLACILPIAVRYGLNARAVPVTIPVMISGLMICFIFFFTKYAAAAEDATTLNRAIFHVFPSIFLAIKISLFYILRVRV